MILHITSIDNIVDGIVLDPERVKHGIITGKRVTDLSWWINPVIHLNLDLPSQLLDAVFVVSRLEKGARVFSSGNGLMYAPVDPRSYRHRGKVGATEMRRVTLRPAIQA